VFSLEGKVLVTGGSRGLGLAIGDAMARAGAHVVLNGPNPSNREVRDAGVAGETACFDVTEELARLFQRPDRPHWGHRRLCLSETLSVLDPVDA
jgi:NAD(P)-dependent dehydrogenase (short-subunit alcohol dehydrogenase family)